MAMKYRIPELQNEQDSWTELMIHHVPNDLKQTFKARCARRGDTMRDTILVLMEGFVEGRYRTDV